MTTAAYMGIQKIIYHILQGTATGTKIAGHDSQAGQSSGRS